MARVLRWLDDHRNFMQQRLDDVKALVRRIFVAAYGETKKFDIELFGSMKYGVCLPDSDIDLAIVVPGSNFRNVGDLFEGMTCYFVALGPPVV